MADFKLDPRVLETLKSLPIVPLVIGGVVTVMGCMLLLGIGYAVLVPPADAAAQVRATATRRYVTVTPIMTATPLPTSTPTATATGLPTDVPTNTPVVPTNVPVTRVPNTAVPPTATSIPPTAVLGAELGLDNARLSMDMTSQGKGLTIPFFAKVRNSNTWAVPFGYLGVAAQDDAGTSVAFRKLKINDSLPPGEVFTAHDAIKIYKIGDFNVYFVICVSPNDDICDQPGADYHLLAGPERVTITG